METSGNEREGKVVKYILCVKLGLFLTYAE